MKRQNFLSVMFVVAAAFLAITGTRALAGPDNLGMLSLDQLLDIDVVSVAKVPEKVMNTPAAIQVITQEDLRRSGVDSIPEALRLVPGMHVYRIDANKWAISARGFTSQFSNKMLVMIDGRIVYSPLFSGVFWDVQDMMMEDIDRIEVIRGPGGSLWGTNAVNGIINIISKDSADSQGTLVTLQGGNYDRGTVAARYGGWLDERTSYRVYGKYFDRDNFEPVNFAAAHDIDDIAGAADDYHAGRLGFRLDRNQGNHDKTTLQGDIYDGASGVTTVRPSLHSIMSPQVENADVSGGNLLGRWNHIFSPGADLTFQCYYDRTKRDDGYLREIRDTLDFDFQQRQVFWQQHELLWGLEYRYTHDNIDTNKMPGEMYFLRFDPDSRGSNLYTGFIQDRFHFAAGQGELTIGTKVEHNDYTGMEWQPSLRFLWRFTERYSFWGAVSRSIRTPSRLENDGTINTRPVSVSLTPSFKATMVPRLYSDGNLDPEKVLSYEVGFRCRPTDDLFVDITAFYNSYHDLIAGFRKGTPALATDDTLSYMVIPIFAGNNFDAETFGVELSSNWSVRPWWRLTTGFSWFDNNMLDENGCQDPRPEFHENNESKYQLSLLSYLDLPGNMEFNGIFFYVSKLEDMNIDGYSRLDLNLTWHATEELTLTVGGRNLLDPWHPEYDGLGAGVFGSEIPRTFYGKISWSF